MRFLVDADLPRSAVRLLRSEGHDATDVRDIGLGDAKDEVIAQHARETQSCIVTGDFDFSDIRAYPPAEHFGIVVLMIPGTASSKYILELLRRFAQQHDIIAGLTGKLAIVEMTRIRLRSS